MNILAMLIQLVIVFVYVFGIHFAFYSAEKLSEWLTFKRLVAIFMGALATLIIGLFVLIQLGWIQYGTPYDAPGFEEGRAEQQQAPEASGPPPKIKSTVSNESIDSTGEKHKQKLKQFEKEKEAP